MEIDRNTTLGGAAVPGTPTQATNLDRDDFMRLLIAQIENQDPAEPMDTTQMMSQLTELTSVEHLIGIEQRLEGVQIANASMANAQVSGFVGHEVVADTSTLRLGELGGTHGALRLAADADQVTVQVRNGDGQVIRTMELGAQEAGTVDYTWDGNDEGGTRLPAGAYRVEVEARSEGALLESHTELTGTVSGVSYEGGYPQLLVGDNHRVLMGDVRELRR